MRREDEGVLGEEAERRLAEEAEEYELSKRTSNDGERFWEWLKFGISEGWVSEPYCDTHDGIPMTDEEAEEYWEEMDNCMFSIRLYEN